MHTVRCSSTWIQDTQLAWSDRSRDLGPATRLEAGPGQKRRKGREKLVDSLGVNGGWLIDWMTPPAPHAGRAGRGCTVTLSVRQVPAVVVVDRELKVR